MFDPMPQLLCHIQYRTALGLTMRRDQGQTHGFGDSGLSEEVEFTCMEDLRRRATSSAASLEIWLDSPPHRLMVC